MIFFFLGQSTRLSWDKGIYISGRKDDNRWQSGVALPGDPTRSTGSKRSPRIRTTGWALEEALSASWIRSTGDWRTPWCRPEGWVEKDGLPSGWRISTEASMSLRSLAFQAGIDCTPRNNQGTFATGKIRLNIKFAAFWCLFLTKIKVDPESW